jgi:hypothetical protein
VSTPGIKFISNIPLLLFSFKFNLTLILGCVQYLNLNMHFKSRSLLSIFDFKYAFLVEGLAGE